MRAAVGVGAVRVRVAANTAVRMRFNVCSFRFGLCSLCCGVHPSGGGGTGRGALNPVRGSSRLSA